ncbi:MAG TPA: PDZ domain-containing protein [Chthoniobacteraceae bacterium]|jgi:tricorn protease|nr:PDZ domain-containing protein [Chthoniobacteraceae bacterium]
MMQMPAVSATQIAFCYGGDIWLVPKTGGTAMRLSSPQGAESFPRFSPDGTQLAFTANYEGGDDIYLMPVTGGAPRRLTHHGGPERVLGWYPDGKSILFASKMTSFTDRVGQFFKVNAEGGLPEQLPVAYGEFGAVSPDGKLFAFTTATTDFSTWKRYRGGMAPDIWLYDLAKGTAENVTQNDASDSLPMWHNTILYYLSDRDLFQHRNLWAYDTETKKTRQVTDFHEDDVRFPSMGPSDIVFEKAGRLYLLDLATEKISEVDVRIINDRATLRPHAENVSGFVRWGGISPTGKRAVFEARGEIFTVPAGEGVVRNLTNSSGVAERYPAWSPDGRWIAYFSDRTGEYELTIRPSNGDGPEQTLTKLGPGWRYAPQWSPDSKKVLFIDAAMKMWVYDFATQKAAVIDHQLWQYHADLEAFRASWSSDSRWIAYSRDLENRQAALVLYDFANAKPTQVTSGVFDDDQPVFDPEDRYLFYRSKRSGEPIYSDYDNTWVYANGQVIVAVPLRQEIISPLAPHNDEEPMRIPLDDEPAKPSAPKPEEPPPAAAERPSPSLVNAEVALKEEEASTKPVPFSSTPGKSATPAPAAEKGLRIDLENFEARAVVLPVGCGRFDDLVAVRGRILFTRQPRAGADGGRRPLCAWNIEDRDEDQVLEDVSGVDLSADGRKLLVNRGRHWGITTVREGQSGLHSLALGGLEIALDPMAEWRQLFVDAWRLERDYFYDPQMHGVDWLGMRRRYEKLLGDCVTRSDVNYVIGEMLGELNCSHVYRSGGDLDLGPQRNVGYLGCDFALEQGAYKVKRILEVAAWDYAQRPPLRQPGVRVKEGDFILAVNGRPLDPTQDPWAAFQGLGDKTVQLTVNSRPSLDGARQVLVTTVSDESAMRQLAWVEANRRRVEKESGGKVGYLYVRNTGAEGQAELYRQFRAQFNKPALIVDERWNSGGQIPDRFVELLGRRVTNYWSVRDGQDWQTPAVAHGGPKAMLVNGWSGSGGDCLPWMFRRAGLGPVIGQRTWGGLIGMTGAPALIDGGHVTVPTFSIYDTAGSWIIEGSGVTPDLEVVDDPAALAKGGDPQLDRAIKEMMGSLQAAPIAQPKRPAYPNRAGLVEVKAPAPGPGIAGSATVIGQR